MWKLNNTPLNTQWVKVENKGYWKYLESNENKLEHTKTYDMQKKVLIEEFIAVNVYIKKKKDPKTIT